MSELEELFNHLSPDLNVDGLLSLINEEEIPLQANELLNRSLGLASNQMIYLNTSYLYYMPKEMIYFIILHEIAHYKRIKKMGLNALIEFMSCKDFDKFADGIFNEENIADRYGRFVFYKLNNRIINQPMQNLHLKENQEKYKKGLGVLFGKVDNSEETYNEMIKSILL